MTDIREQEMQNRIDALVLEKENLSMNITVTEYRQSGEMETAVPVFRKPAFRKNGNHYGC